MSNYEYFRTTINYYRRQTSKKKIRYSFLEFEICEFQIYFALISFSFRKIHEKRRILRVIFYFNWCFLKLFVEPRHLNEHYTKVWSSCGAKSQMNVLCIITQLILVHFFRSFISAVILAFFIINIFRLVIYVKLQIFRHHHQFLPKAVIR